MLLVAILSLGYRRNNDMSASSMYQDAQLPNQDIRTLVSIDQLRVLVETLTGGKNAFGNLIQETRHSIVGSSCAGTCCSATIKTSRNRRRSAPVLENNVCLFTASTRQTCLCLWLVPRLKHTVSGQWRWHRI